MPSLLYGTHANSADPDQTSHNAMSDQDFHYLLTECYIKILKKKNEKYHRTPLKLEMVSDMGMQVHSA